MFIHTVSSPSMKMITIVGGDALQVGRYGKI